MINNSNSGNYITASILYSYMKCEHRVWRDIYGPKDEKIVETNPFVELLWERGLQHEQKIIQQLGEYLDLSEGTFDERHEKTISAMKKSVPLIYQGVLIHQNLLGIPDVLKLQTDGTYIPIEIKSGMGYERGDDSETDGGKPKKTYAVQLALYVELLHLHGFAKDWRGEIIDINAKRAEYDLNQQIGVRDKRTFWEFYEEIKRQVAELINNESNNLPASSSQCKLCSWFDSCNKWFEETDDLTGLYEIGRGRRDTIARDIGISRIQDALTLDKDKLLLKKKKERDFLKNIGADILDKIIRRANILKNTKTPVIYGTITFPKKAYELFFDIENDPTQEFVYLHGIYERGPQGERFVKFVAKEISSKAEREAWIEFWKYIKSVPEDDYLIFYFGWHEKTMYRKLQEKYPDVISKDMLEAFFNNPNAIELYSIVSKNSDWPMGSYSLKDLAKYIGFEWRDDTPSGALSIQWFNEYLKTGDDRILERILLYNEDDCKATMVLKDKLEELSLYSTSGLSR